MNAKAKGSRNERRTIALFEALGYVCCKAGGSLGMFDIIAINAAETVCIQVKSNRQPGVIEMEGLKMFKKHPNCRVLVHRWDDYARLPKVIEV